jgi:hypothetical protein
VTGSAVTARLAACERCCESFSSPVISAVIASPPPIPKNPDDQPAMAPMTTSAAHGNGSSSGSPVAPSAFARGGRGMTIAKRMMR